MSLSLSLSLSLFIKQHLKISFQDAYLYYYGTYIFIRFNECEAQKHLTWVYNIKTNRKNIIYEWKFLFSFNFHQSSFYSIKVVISSFFWCYILMTVDLHIVTKLWQAGVLLQSDFVILKHTLFENCLYMLNEKKILWLPSCWFLPLRIWD